MFQEIAYMPIFGKSLILYLGVATILSFILTAILGYLIHTGRISTDIKWHLRVAVFSLLLAFIHGALGILAYF